MPITVEQAREALSKVDDPEIKKDLITLNMAREIEVIGDKVKFTLVLTTPACPLRTQIEDDCKQALIDAGATEVEIQTTAEVRGGNAPGKQDLSGIKNIIAISSGKGGVGKSTVTVNLAISLAKAGAKVGIIDADITGPNIPLMLGITDKPALNEDGSKMIPQSAHGIHAISMGMIIDDNEAVTWRGPMLHKAITQFFRDVIWEDIDYLLVDLPPGTGDAQLTICQSVPVAGAVIVSTPQDVAILDSRKGLRMFENMNVPLLGVIENMSYFIAPDTNNEYDIFGRGGVLGLAKELDTECLGQVPIEIGVRRGGDTGLPITVGSPNSSSAVEFKKIAEKVAAKLSLQAVANQG